MQIDVNEDGLIRIRDIYNPIELVGDDCSVFVCQRDGRIEIEVGRKKGDGKNMSLAEYVALYKHELPEMEWRIPGDEQALESLFRRRRDLGGEESE